MASPGTTRVRVGGTPSAGVSTRAGTAGTRTAPGRPGVGGSRNAGVSTGGGVRTAAVRSGGSSGD